MSKYMDLEPPPRICGARVRRGLQGTVEHSDGGRG
jgi:hypothetical protein